MFWRVIIAGTEKQIAQMQEAFSRNPALGKEGRSHLT